MIVCISGCVSIERSDYESNDKDQFLASKNGTILVVPKSLTNSNVSDFYILPDQTQNAKIDIMPPFAK